MPGCEMLCTHYLTPSSLELFEVSAIFMSILSMKKLRPTEELCLSSLNQPVAEPGFCLTQVSARRGSMQRESLDSLWRRGRISTWGYGREKEFQTEGII